MTPALAPSHAGGSPVELPSNVGNVPDQLALWRGRDRWIRKWTVPSTTRSDVKYTVSADAAGNFGCSCPGWIYTFPRRPCKHIRHIQATDSEELAS